MIIQQKSETLWPFTGARPKSFWTAIKNIKTEGICLFVPSFNTKHRRRVQVFPIKTLVWLRTRVLIFKFIESTKTNFWIRNMLLDYKIARYYVIPYIFRTKWLLQYAYGLQIQWLCLIYNLLTTQDPPQSRINSLFIFRSR